jgi:hypothetical protein
MSSADEQVTCGHCDRVFRRRDLRFEHTIVERCPVCREIVEGETSSGWRNDDVILQENVAAIDTWLDSVSAGAGLETQRIADKESMGEYLWLVCGLPFDSRCEVLYARDRPDVVSVRLCVDAPPVPFLFDTDERPELPGTEKLKEACSFHGVQPDGVRGSKGSWWGASQTLRTGWLPQGLFRPVVDRLDKVIREVKAGA